MVAVGFPKDSTVMAGAPPTVVAMRKVWLLDFDLFDLSVMDMTNQTRSSTSWEV